MDLKGDLSSFLSLRVEYVEFSGVQHGFILPENLRPYKLVGTGTAGVVLCCATERGELVAIKKIRSETEQEQRRALREVLLMCQLQHPNIVGAQDFYLPCDIPVEHRSSTLRLQMRRSSTDHICVRMPYYPADMSWLIHSSTQVLTPEHVQYICVQILSGLRYLHAAEVIHRDLKPSNILVGEDCDVHICDFGLARRENSRLLSQYIVTRWYRPPEVLLCKRQYDKAVDIWSAGCIFAELIMQPSPQRRALFSGLTYMDQTDRIIKMLGAPSEEDLASVCDNSDAENYVRAHFMSPPTLKNRLAEHLQQNARPGLLSGLLLDLIVRMLTFNPRHRITAAAALQHPYFAGCEEARDEDGHVVVPDDGENKCYDEIMDILKQQQALLRFHRERRFDSAVNEFLLPGM